MNLQEALDTANWLLERESVTEGEPQHILRIRLMRDTLYFMYAAAGIHEIIIKTMNDEGHYG